MAGYEACFKLSLCAPDYNITSTSVSLQSHQLFALVVICSLAKVVEKLLFYLSSDQNSLWERLLFKRLLHVYWFAMMKIKKTF